MHLTVKEVYDIAEGLSNIMDKELEVKVAFKIQRNFKKLSEEVKASEEIRKNIVEKYKESEDENGIITIAKDSRDEYQAEIKELLDQSIDIDLQTINIDELGDSIQPRILTLIEPIIKE